MNTLEQLLLEKRDAENMTFYSGLSDDHPDVLAAADRLAAVHVKLDAIEVVDYPCGTDAYLYKGEYFSTFSGQRLRHPDEYATNVEGYTPFGDEGGCDDF
jgi:hypothetical protein